MMETPLGVLRRVRKARQGVDAAPLALALVCAGLVAALSSDFVYSPGMYVGFDGSKSPAVARLNIPRSVKGDEKHPEKDVDLAPSMAQTALTVTLVSTRGMGVFVVDGRVVTSDQLVVELKQAAERGGTARPLLIKTDGSLMMRDFMVFCAAARKAHFPGVMIAANDAPR
jgi:biopolymer transport protein ExbD